MESEARDIPALAQMLLWNEYAKRKNQVWFLPPGHNVRERTDSDGNCWRVGTIAAATDDSSEAFKMAEDFGYDAFNPPVSDYILLVCEVQHAKREAALNEMRRIEGEVPVVIKELLMWKRQKDARTKAGTSNLQEAVDMLEATRERLAGCVTRWKACEDVLVRAITKQYLIPMESMDKMAAYSMPIKARVAKSAGKMPPPLKFGPEVLEMLKA